MSFNFPNLNAADTGRTLDLQLAVPPESVRSIGIQNCSMATALGKRVSLSLRWTPLFGPIFGGW